ncbi:MAG: DedA family protein, partial [Bacteriovoracia bacterium]
PGHLSCGLLGIPLWKFLAIDGTAALISVPTQVWFVATYGEVILNSLQQFKFYLFGGLAILFLLWWIKNRFRKEPVA